MTPDRNAAFDRLRAAPPDPRAEALILIAAQRSKIGADTIRACLNALRQVAEDFPFLTPELVQLRAELTATRNTLQALEASHTRVMREHEVLP